MAPLVLLLTSCIFAFLAMANAIDTIESSAHQNLTVFEAPTADKHSTTLTSQQRARHAKRASNLKSLQRVGVRHFLKTNGPAIGSWFRTVGDSTNGHSWCGYPYHDADPLFAPDVTLMLNDFGGDYEKAARAYCGLEATVVTPAGKKMKLFIGDGFDHRWVRSPGSIDITHTTYGKLYKVTNNRNDVIKGVKWTLTGNRSNKYCFKCRGNN